MDISTESISALRQSFEDKLNEQNGECSLYYFKYKISYYKYIYTMIFHISSSVQLQFDILFFS